MTASFKIASHNSLDESRLTLEREVMLCGELYMAKISKEARQKISRKLKGIKRSEETRRKMSEAQRTKVDEELQKQVVSKYVDEKKTVEQCAKELNLGAKVVRRVLKEHGIEIRSNFESHTLEIPEEIGKRIVEMYEGGSTVTQCSEKFGYTNTITYYYIKSHTKIRSTASYQKGKKRPKEVIEKISKSKMGHPVSKKVRDNMRTMNSRLSPEQIKMRVTKAFLTKKLNGTVNYSKPEEDLYRQLLKENVNKTIYRQYKDKKRYPYYCDFYIVEDDLFIELNAHWTHGGKPYDENDEECREKLRKWQELAKTSKFYQTAIEVWTIRDPEKLACAKRNRLNYKVIY